MQAIVQIEQIDSVVAEIGHSPVTPRDNAGSNRNDSGNQVNRIPPPIDNSNTPRASGERYAPILFALLLRSARAHDLAMAQLVANAALHGITPGHQQQAHADADQERNHPGGLIEHQAKELLQGHPRE